MINKLMYTAFALIFILGIIGFFANISMMNACIKSGNPNSQECFKYNVMNNNMRNVNVNGELK